MSEIPAEVTLARVAAIIMRYLNEGDARDALAEITGALEEGGVKFPGSD